ncbi:hypothetical protein BIV04_01770 [Frigoribacterium sp. MCBA15_019]|nr:hypothetical protein BIV04_01770 [Frigoribacterium sp. MCBA15_019]
MIELRHRLECQFLPRRPAGDGVAAEVGDASADGVEEGPCLGAFGRIGVDAATGDGEDFLAAVDGLAVVLAVAGRDEVLGDGSELVQVQTLCGSFCRSSRCGAMATSAAWAMMRMSVMSRPLAMCFLRGRASKRAMRGGRAQPRRVGTVRVMTHQSTSVRTGSGDAAVRSLSCAPERQGLR